MDRFIKLFRKSINGSNCCVQISNNYSGSNFKHILSLVTELRKYFNVTDDKISFYTYNGENVGVTFIECYLPPNTIMPAGFLMIEELEDIK